MTDEFTPIERRVLSRIQCDFPLHEDPYGVLAGELGYGRDEVLAAVLGLRRRGVIRRLGGSFVPRRLNYLSVLVAACVSPARLEAVAGQAASYSEVTHNYEREDRFNLWFTVIAASQGRLAEILATIRGCEGVEELHALPALRTFKIRVDFDLGGGARVGDLRGEWAASRGGLASQMEAGLASAVYSVDDLDRRIIPRCCGDVGDSVRPFAALAAELGLSESTLLARLLAYREAGVLRRFGAILWHQAAGFVANGMSVWNVPEAEVERVGRLMAACPDISHCYERPRLAGWPYNVFGMIHGRSGDECLAVARRLGQATGVADYRILFSRREFKKTSMVYAMA